MTPFKRGRSWSWTPKGSRPWTRTPTTTAGSTLLILKSHDFRIFSLAILLSSVFLYNSTGPIDESAIQQLGLVMQVVKDLELACGQDLKVEEICGNFVWVARDFALRMEDHLGHPITSDQ